MKRLLIKTIVRARFRMTSREQASKRISSDLHDYLNLADEIGVVNGARIVRIPPMLGVDEDMREWSFFMILEHNTIVNRSISAIVTSLTRGEEPQGVGAINPKTDVMPSSDPGEEQVRHFKESVESHLETVAALPGLRGTRTKRHPVFGMLDAHGWHCMFGLHAEVHLKQALAVGRLLKLS
jgi:hypothetical protein